MSKTSASRLAAIMITLAFAGPALAHAHLKAATPADKAAVSDSPKELDLTFSEPLNLKFSGIKLIGPDKSEIKTGAPMLMDADKTLMVTVPVKLSAGDYTVEWHVLSTDGHRTEGTYGFSVKP
ncbi:copper homeostasis periplasmic binding protein CopC [Rhizobium oryzicola]|uniref:Copper homeostasis periplasmic binding protein CopC n=1 Tax=Rhizobium oryzicola TaxID=1232668 RepID=A0ABT8SVV0_9HYPH|nr:copper homeostasis periplasmic binding protein CopC [Rhizobium oryzicola]MDO1582572.1 copper homeostasis periplasmic binding protein CopC [Rhizobium oryzicola]